MIDRAYGYYDQSLSHPHRPPSVSPAAFRGHARTLFGWRPKWAIKCGWCHEVFRAKVPQVSRPEAQCPSCRAINILPVRLVRAAD